MILVKLLIVILNFVAVRTISIVHDNPESARSLFKLKARDVPQCVQQPGFGSPPSFIPGQESDRRQDLWIDRNAQRYVGWRPSLCQKKYWLCVYILKGVSYVSRGIPGSGNVDETFWLGGGTSVQAIWYWQGTLQYTAPRGSVNIYPAHGNFWICVKGGMRVQVVGGVQVDYYGNSTDSNDLLCHCYWQDDGERSSDNDIIIHPTA